MVFGRSWGMMIICVGKRDLWKSGREMVKKLLFLFGIEDSVEICESQYGKPYINKYDNIEFNISDTDSYVAVAINDENISVGIDIESLERKYNPQIVKKIFTENEKKAMENSLNATQTFYEIWTLKEAYLKAIGTGVTGEIRLIDTTESVFRKNCMTRIIKKYNLVCSVYMVYGIKKEITWIEM